MRSVWGEGVVAFLLLLGLAALVGGVAGWLVARMILSAVGWLST